MMPAHAQSVDSLRRGIGSASVAIVDTLKAINMEKQLYEICYKLHGEPRLFIIGAAPLNELTAWQWAACDMGIGIIPRSDRDKTRRLTRAAIESVGVSAVVWKPCDNLFTNDQGQVAGE